MEKVLLMCDEASLREWVTFCEFFGTAFSPEIRLTLRISSYDMLDLLRMGEKYLPSSHSDAIQQSITPELIANMSKWLCPLVDLSERVHLNLLIPKMAPDEGIGGLSINNTVPKGRLLSWKEGKERIVDFDCIQESISDNGVPRTQRPAQMMEAATTHILMHPALEPAPQPSGS
jgi:hypothetical protein